MPDFSIWPQCNIGCVFCSNPVSGFRETTDKYSYAEMVRKVGKYKRGLRTFVKFDEVGDYFNLTGGEPTLHPDFLKIVALLRTEFPRSLVRVLSNGRLFSYEDFARRTMGVGLAPFEVAVPLFGYDARTHEATSRTPGSFAQTMAGLENLRRHRGPGQRVEVRIILTRIQLKSLSGLLDMVLEKLSWVDQVVFLFVELEGFAEQYRDRVCLTMTEAAAALDALYDKVVRLPEARLYHFPLCAVPPRLWPFVYNTLAGFKVTWLDGCASCAHRPQCVGVHKSYVKHMGAPDIRPFAAPLAVEPSGDRYHPFGLPKEARAA
ncbi:MAG: radical SAM protein [Elusimicrobia bacterium]|nr:radical SAM protein [Elusimicrobiota bacterium]